MSQTTTKPGKTDPANGAADDLDLEVLQQIINALRPLDHETRCRILQAVAVFLGLEIK